jgi:predicted amidophosphoribosyltransferase
MEEEEQDETPLQEPLSIREYSESRQQETCVVCGKVKKPYIQIESGNSVEYTCEDCYRTSMGEVIPAMECVECRSEMIEGDKFCGKCGAEQERTCRDCGEATTGQDAYCGKCGAKL